jgi:hypothetical protein
VAIIIINEILSAVTISGKSWVGYDTHSELLSQILSGVFISQFFNSGVLLVLIQANMTEHTPTFITKYFKGPLYDYYPLWYQRVGSVLVLNSIIEAVMPWVDLLVEWVIPAIF